MNKKSKTKKEKNLKKIVLTHEVIDQLLDFIVPQPLIPKDVAQSITFKNKNALIKQLLGKEIYINLLPELKLELKKQYNATLIQPGESVGILCAQSVGEQNTQSTLSCVHKDTKILIKINNRTKVLTIAEFTDKLMQDKNNKIQFANNNQTEYLVLTNIKRKPETILIEKNSIVSPVKIKNEDKNIIFKKDSKNFSRKYFQTPNGVYHKVCMAIDCRSYVYKSPDFCKKHHDYKGELETEIKCDDTSGDSCESEDSSSCDSENDAFESCDNVEKEEKKEDIEYEEVEVNEEIGNDEKNKYEILSVDKNGKISWNKITIASRQKVDTKLLHITTLSKREIITTKTHKFVLRKDNVLKRVKASELSIDDRIPIAVGYPKNEIYDTILDLKYYFSKKKFIYGTDYNLAQESYNKLPFNELFRNKTKSEITKKMLKIRTENTNVWWEEYNHRFPHRCPIKFEGNNTRKKQATYENGFIYTFIRCINITKIPEKLELTNDLGFIFGIWLAEGSFCGSAAVSIANREDNILERVKKFCDNNGLKYKTFRQENHMTTTPKGKPTEIRFFSSLWQQLFKSTCGYGCKNKHIPDFAFTANNEFVSGLLDGYFSGDGTITEDGKDIKAVSTSRELLEGMSVLFLRFNIFSKIRISRERDETGNNNFNSKITLRIWEISIGTQNITKFKDHIGFTMKSKQDRLDKPNNRRFIYSPIDKIPEVNTEIFKGIIQRDDILKLLQKQNISESDKQILETAFNSDVLYDPIVKISEVEYNDYVYDLTVEPNHTFMTYDSQTLISNSFHSSGLANSLLTQGIPRMLELLNATLNPKNVVIKAFFKKQHNTIANLRETIGDKIIELTFKNISDNIIINLKKEKEPWYDNFKLMYNDDFTKCESAITIKVNMNIIYEYKLTLSKIAKCINDRWTDLFCVWSPIEYGQLDIFVDTTNIYLPKDRDLFFNESNMNEIYLEEVILPIIESTVISGVKNLYSMCYTKDPENKDNWCVEILGNNYLGILSLSDLIDETRTVSNNIWEIYNVLGIEALRQYLIDEFKVIMGGINECHILLLVSRMTYSGTISSITRYTMKKDECGPFGKASFEESVNNFIKAACNGDIENTNGVSASIICSKKIKEDVFSLSLDFDHLPESK